MADQIIAKSNGSYTPPPEAQYLVVCCDVIDLGMIENTKFGKREHKCALVFQLDELNAQGKRYEVAERFTVSMHEKARLRQFLGQWRGKSYTEDEAREGAPLHKLVGVNAIVQIEHRQANGKTYANILSIGRPHKNLAKIEVVDYVRSANWKKAEEPAPAPDDEFPPPPDDDEGMPF